MNIDLKEIFKRFTAKARGGGHNPFRDWKIAVIVFLTANTLCVAGSLYLFWLINSGMMFETGETVQPKTETLDKAALHSLAVEFDQKSEAFESARINRVRLADPSM